MNLISTIRYKTTINQSIFFRKLVEYVNQTDFHGVSGHIKFNGSNRPGSINVLQYFYNGTRLVGQFTPAILKGGHLQIDETKIHWLTSNGARPHDGHHGKILIIDGVDQMKYKISV